MTTHAYTIMRISAIDNSDNELTQKEAIDDNAFMTI